MMVEGALVQASTCVFEHIFTQVHILQGCEQTQAIDMRAYGKAEHSQTHNTLVYIHKYTKKVKQDTQIMCTRTRTHTRTYIHTHTYTHRHTQTGAHTHANTHTHMRTNCARRLHTPYATLRASRPYSLPSTLHTPAR
jgi:hypothetical protein